MQAEKVLTRLCIEPWQQLQPLLLAMAPLVFSLYHITPLPVSTTKKTTTICKIATRLCNRSRRTPVTDQRDFSIIQPTHSPFIGHTTALDPSQSILSRHYIRNLVQRVNRSLRTSLPPLRPKPAGYRFKQRLLPLVDECFRTVLPRIH